MVRITDRGPFVPGRMVDLSLAAAKAVDVYLPGTAKVRLEVLQAPLSLDTGGRWAVQIGSFTGKKAAAELAEHLQQRYQTAKVVKFMSPAGRVVGASARTGRRPATRDCSGPRDGDCRGSGISGAARLKNIFLQRAVEVVLLFPPGDTDTLSPGRLAG